jgi:hypothetical protein
VTITAKSTGPGGDYNLSAAFTYDSAHFGQPSFTPAPSASALSGGYDPSAIDNQPFRTLCASIRKAQRPMTARSGAPARLLTIHSRGCSRPTILSREPSRTLTTSTAICCKRPRPRPTRPARPPRP